MFEVTGNLAKDSLNWANLFDEYEKEADMMELQEGLAALKMAEKHGKSWFKWLSEDGSLPTTEMTIRNRMEYAEMAMEVFNRTGIDLGSIAQVGYQRLRDLKKREKLFSKHDLGAAAELSGSDWKKHLQEMDGEEPNEDQIVNCPACHRRTTIDKLDAAYVGV